MPQQRCWEAGRLLMGKSYQELALPVTLGLLSRVSTCTEAGVSVRPCRPLGEMKCLPEAMIPWKSSAILSTVPFQLTTGPLGL